MKNIHKIIVITAPSGAGKTSITQYLLEKIEHLSFSISAATRKPRLQEKDGVDYYFLSETDFKQRINNHEFVEWEMVYEGKYYGTLKSEMDRIWGDGKVPVLDIDVKGAIHIQQEYGDKVFSIFIQTPTIEDLRNRLVKRGTETPETLETRINKALYEISFKHKFDAIVINENLFEAQRKAEDLVRKFLEED